MNKYKVLVFPAGTEIANEIIAALKDNKTFSIELASSEEGSYADFREQKVYRLPFVDDDTFINELNSLTRALSIDFLFPAHDDVAYAISKNESELFAKAVGQNFTVNDLVRFKDKTYQYFSDLLPVARVFEQIELINTFPVFTKPKRGQGSANSYKLDDIKDLEYFASSKDFSEFVFMEYLSGEEYTIDCFSHHSELLYSGPRTRDKILNGIAVKSSLVTKPDLLEELKSYAKTISEQLELHGPWFFQMKRGEDSQLKLLEIGPRVSGTMMLNRMLGVNFVELALYQALGLHIEVIVNEINVSLARALTPIYKHNIAYTELYVDFDDTLYLDEDRINTDLIKLIFDAKNHNKPVHLITKNKKNNLASALHKYGILHIFDSIIHLAVTQSKADYMPEGSVLIDDSFTERKAVINAGKIALGVDAIPLLIK